MSAQHTPGPWRTVKAVGKLTNTYRGPGSARTLMLDCGHQRRLTGDRALVYPNRMRCADCAAIAKAEGRS